MFPRFRTIAAVISSRVLVSSFASLLFVSGLTSCGSGDSGGGGGAPKPAAPDGGGGGGGEAEPPPPAPKGPPGKVALTVKYEGAVPERKALDHGTEEFCKDKIFDDSLVVDAGTKGLKNAVLRIEKVRAPRKKGDITITNRNCAFEPRVQVAVRGMKVGLANDDEVTHNTNARFDSATFVNQALGKNTKEEPLRPLNKLGVMKIKCDVHSWMTGYVVVSDNPFIGVSDEKGTLTLDEVPPGTYPYTLWHESLGEKKGEVTVVSGETAKLDVSFAAKN
ncbi:MAG: hypothetical protein AAF517_16330 [Planctomycetota bacterium]